MMFLDASAVVASLTGELEAALFLDRMEQANRCYVSAIVLYEAVAAVARVEARAPEAAHDTVAGFFQAIDAQTIALDANIGAAAVTAFAAYGKGRHPAGLNMGDCFTYACAKLYRLPVLFKGDDFPKTDIKSVLAT